jgi:hypothetical protein
MASRAKAKKHDGPTIAVRIERGTLVPASAYDLELLDQWREGAVLNIEAVRAEVPPLERKYFAELSHLLKAAETGWSNTDTAHEALKKATGFVTPIKRKGGWDSLSRHIASFTDRELSEFYELFLGIAQRRFGIDPSELQREAPNSEYLSSGADAYATAADDGPSVGTIPPDAGEPSSGDDPSPDEPAAGGDLSTPRDTPPANGITQLTDEDMFWLKQCARLLCAASGDDPEVLENQRRMIKQYWTPATISAQARAIAKQIYDRCKTGNPSKIEIATLAGCRLEDLRPEAR